RDRNVTGVQTCALPISLSSLQVNVMTALVSFDRVFEVLDLKPLVAEKPDAVALPRTESGPGALAPEIEFDDVSFRYPTASEVSRSEERRVGKVTRDDEW